MAASSSSSSIKLSDEDNWANEVILALSRVETDIPHCILGASLPDDILEEKHITQLLDYQVINDWITTGELGSVLLVTGYKHPQDVELIAFEFDKKTVTIDGNHDWSQHRPFAKSDDEKAKNNIRMGIKYIQQTLDTSLKSVNSFLDTLFMRQKLKTTGSILTVSSMYPKEVKAELDSINSMLRTITHVKRLRKMKKGEVLINETELAKLLLPVKTKYDGLVERLRNDAIMALLAAKTVKTDLSEKVEDKDAHKASAIDSLGYLDKKRELVEARVAGLSKGPSIQSHFKDDTEEVQALRDKHLIKTAEQQIVHDEGDKPILQKYGSHLSAESDSSEENPDPVLVEDNIGDVDGDSSPAKKPSPYKYKPIIGSIDVDTSTVLPSLQNPFLHYVATDSGTFVPTSPYIKTFTISNTKASYPKQYDIGGKSIQEAPEDTKNMFSIALLKSKLDDTYITLIEPTITSDKKLANNVILYMLTSTGLIFIKRFNYDELNPNVNFLAKLVGKGEIDSHFARLLKFIADRLVLANLLKLNANNLIVYTNDTFGAYSLLHLKILSYDETTQTVNKDTYAIQTILTRMAENFTVHGVLYDKNKTTMDELQQELATQLTAEKMQEQLKKQKDNELSKKRIHDRYVDYYNERVKESMEKHYPLITLIASDQAYKASKFESNFEDLISESDTTKVRRSVIKDIIQKWLEQKFKEQLEQTFADELKKELVKESGQEPQSKRQRNEAAETVEVGAAEAAEMMEVDAAETEVDAANKLHDDWKAKERAMARVDVKKVVKNFFIEIKKGDKVFDDMKYLQGQVETYKQEQQNKLEKKRKKKGGEKNTYKSKKSKKSRKSKKHKSKKSRKSRKVNKSRKSRKPKKSRKQSHYKSLFGKTLKRHTKTI